jgi:hypothetical protein
MLLAAAAAVGPDDGKTAALDDWSAIKIIEVGQDSPSQPPYYLRVATGDLDGDGRADEAFIKLACDGAALTEASIMLRESPTMASSGKRMHKPITFVKEWGAATPELVAVKPTYNIKEMKGVRMSTDGGGWTAVTLANADGLCGASAAAASVNTSHSNIKNK